MFREFATAEPLPSGPLTPWRDAVSDVLFPVDTMTEATAFSGRLLSWNLGEASVAFMASGPVSYLREARHLAADKEDVLLVSFATRSEIVYTQGGLELTCRRNQMLVEQSCLPSLFVQALAENEVWSLRVPLAVMKRRLGAVERMPSMVADAGHGTAALLHDMLRLIPSRLATSGGAERAGVADTLVDLLALAIENDTRAVHSGLSTVRRAHLARIERHVRRHLTDPALCPDTIAAACGISVRYLNALFAQAHSHSIGQWIRALRLEAAAAQLADPRRAETIAETAFHWGFHDPAQFSRHFRRRFGHSPRELRGHQR